MLRAPTHRHRGSRRSGGRESVYVVKVGGGPYMGPACSFSIARKLHPRWPGGDEGYLCHEDRSGSETGLLARRPGWNPELNEPAGLELGWVLSLGASYQNHRILQWGFWAYLLSQQPTTAIPPSKAPAMTNDKMNILLVDDQPSKLLTYEAVLSDLGENLITATSGMEALDKLLKHDIALVLMDVSMPGMDGFETAQMIHEHPRFENTPIVFVSGIHVTELDRLKGYEHGAVDYIPVPVTPSVLRAKVKVLADLHRKTRQLEALNEQITRVQEEERRRMARDLHDSVGQLLVAISMNCAVLALESQKLSPDAANRLAENATMVNEVIKQIRTISYLLHPPLLEEAGIASALRCYLEGFAKRSGISVRLDIDSRLGRQVPEIEIAVFRLVQEGLTNIHRHSGSREAEIHVSRSEAILTVEVVDFGGGMTSTDLTNQAGVGILGMQERLRALGGTLRIRSNEEGTSLTGTIPLKTLRLPADRPLGVGDSLPR